MNIEEKKAERMAFVFRSIKYISPFTRGFPLSYCENINFIHLPENDFLLLFQLFNYMPIVFC